MFTDPPVGANAPGAKTPDPTTPPAGAPAGAPDPAANPPTNLPNDPLKLPDQVTKAIITDDDVSALQSEYAKDGKLSDATLAALEQKGIPRKFVEQYVKGGEALTQKTVESLYAEVGGKDNFNRMRGWAATLTKEERDAYQTAINTGNASVVALAVRGMYSKYTAANGKDPTLNSGSGRAPSGPAPFRSRAEMVAAIRDGKYSTDPAYRSAVEARIAATQEFAV